MKRVDFDDYTVPEQPVEQPAESTSSKWLLVVVAVIVALAAIVLLRQPVSQAVRSHLAQSDLDRQERKRQAEYQALERAVTSRTTMLHLIGRLLMLLALLRNNFLQPRSHQRVFENVKPSRGNS